MVQFLSIIFFLGFLQFLLGISKVPVFLCHLYYCRENITKEDFLLHFYYRILYCSKKGLRMELHETEQNVMVLFLSYP